MGVVIVGGAGYIGARLAPLIPGAMIIDPVTGIALRDAGPVLAAADAVVYLAGHSGRAKCRQDPIGAAQGVADFVWLCSLIKRTCRIVYASSAALYGRTMGPHPATERYPAVPSDVYTWTKLAMEEYARVSGLETYGLRFGVVAGWSPRFRDDTVVNGMAASAIRKAAIRVLNPRDRRPVLGIRDCCAAIMAALQSKSDCRGIYNVASFSTTIGRIASQITDEFGPLTQDVFDIPGKADFAISTEKFQRTFGFCFGDRIGSILAELSEHREALIADRPPAEAPGSMLCN